MSYYNPKPMSATDRKVVLLRELLDAEPDLKESVWEFLHEYDLTLKDFVKSMPKGREIRRPKLDTDTGKVA